MINPIVIGNNGKTKGELGKDFEFNNLNKLIFRCSQAKTLQTKGEPSRVAIKAE